MPESELDALLEWAVEHYPHPIIEALRERDALRARVAELAGEVRTWLCDDCNTVYPGPPAPDVWCAMCPKCGGATGPKNSIEARRAKRRIAELEAERERIIAVLVHEMQTGGMNGLEEADIRDLLKPE